MLVPFWRALIPALLVLTTLSGHAADDRMAVSVDGGDADQVAFFTGSLSEMLGQTIRMVPPSEADVRVALDAASFARALDDGKRVLGVDIPRDRVLAARADGCRCSAFFKGADPRRQLRLIRSLQPGAARVGMLLTPELDWVEDLLAPDMVTPPLALQTATVTDPGRLGGTLGELLPRVDALLAVEETSLFSPATARLVLLTSYRQRRPVVGPDRDFVRAGSLATTYSGGFDLVRSVAQWLEALKARGQFPAPDWPPYFSVTLNEHVARAYDLPVRDPQRLAAELKAQEAP